MARGRGSGMGWEGGVVEVERGGATATSMTTMTKHNSSG